MQMVQTHTRWTAAMVRALPEDRNRYESLRGELLVSPSPALTHQAAVVNLIVSLSAYLKGNGVGDVLCAPADIELREDTLVQPDVFVVPSHTGRPRKWEDVRNLLLVVEVLSPSSARTDRGRKRELYLEERVEEYWVVDVDSRLVERWRPGDTRPEILRNVIEWMPVGASQPLSLDLQTFFAEVVGE